MKQIALVIAALFTSQIAHASDGTPLHEALMKLAHDGRFSGAVVFRDANGVRFARGYGLADPFSNRPFTPDTPVDSASLAKPVTAAVEETRVWQRTGGKWVHVHFHRSMPA